MVMTMKISIFCVINYDIQQKYDFDYAGDTFSLGTAIGFVIRAKQEFNLPGKNFILNSPEGVYWVSKFSGEWKGRELWLKSSSTPTTGELPS